MPIDDLAIVLTGTIVPNAPFTAHNDPQARRQEYLSALRFYSQFAPVYFLENSIYPLSDDAEFHQLANVMIRQLPPSKSPERGKGYQEFEMIDGWLLSESQPPPRWIKITGRYFYRNFAELLADCRPQHKAEMIIDRCARFQSARTCLFYVVTDFYLQHIAGVFHRCDDERGDWIEHVVYRQLASLPSSNTRVFFVEPHLTAISGSTGSYMQSKPIQYFLKQTLRRLNCRLDQRRLWYAR
jgi:hypothetical protein